MKFLSAFLGLLVFFAVEPAGLSAERICERLLKEYGQSFKSFELHSQYFEKTLFFEKESWEKMGFRSLTKIRKLSEGNSANVYLVDAELDAPPEKDGSKKVQRLAWREVHPKDGNRYYTDIELEGAMLNHIGFEAVKKMTGKPAEHIFPVLGHFSFLRGPGRLLDFDGYLMDLGEHDLGALISPGGELTLNGPRTHLPTITKKLRRMAPVARGIFGGLAELAHAGIVHQDLKPANIVLIRNRVILIDFGLSVLKGWKEWTGGTKAYAAPEKGRIPARGADVRTPAAPAEDFYSASLILTEMLDGLPPEPEPHDYYSDVVEGRFREVREDLEKLGVSLFDLNLFDEMAALALKGLYRNPIERLSAVKALDSPIAQISEDGTILGPKKPR